MLRSANELAEFITAGAARQDEPIPVSLGFLRQVLGLAVEGRRSLYDIEQNIADVGPCDHTVGICNCEALRRRDALAYALHQFFPDGPDRVPDPAEYDIPEPPMEDVADG